MNWGFKSGQLTNYKILNTTKHTIRLERREIDLEPI